MNDKRSKNRKILVSDDSAVVRNIFADHLAEMGFSVFCAENGRKAIDIIRNKNPDLVLVDLMMPEVNGFEVLAYIKKEKPLIPAVVISGTDNIKDVIAALRRGASDFLLKPIEDLSILDHTIGRVLEISILRKRNIEYQKNLEQMVNRRTKELKCALDEKDILIQEIHHRVKNNLSLILAFLNIKQMELTDPEEIRDFREIQSRIFSMALLHEQLYQNKDLSGIDIRQYIQDIINEFSKNYNTDKAEIQFILDIENMNIPLNVCMPLGLIINEIIIETFKNFSGKMFKRTLSILLKKDNRMYRLEIISDKITADDIENHAFNNSTNIFPEMMSNLAQQLDGTFEFDTGNDYKYKVVFPVKNNA